MQKCWKVGQLLSRSHSSREMNILWHLGERSTIFNKVSLERCSNKSELRCRPSVISTTGLKCSISWMIQNHYSVFAKLPSLGGNNLKSWMKWIPISAHYAATRLLYVSQFHSNSKSLSFPQFIYVNVITLCRVVSPAAGAAAALVYILPSTKPPVVPTWPSN